DLDRVVGARPDGHVFAAENDHSCQISRGGRINDNAINAVIAYRLAAQIKQGAVQIEQVGEIERFGCFGTGPFRSRSHNAGIGETEISDELFLSVDFGLFAFDRTKRFRVGQSAVARVQSPQSANETNRSTGRLKLKTLI